MSVCEKNIANSSSGDSDEKEFKSNDDKVYKVGLMIAELTKQLQCHRHTQNIQLQLESLDKLETTCRTFLYDLSTLRATLMKHMVESERVISVLTVEYCYTYTY